MISKERLEELIKEEATIYFYSNDYGIIEEFNLKGCELYHDFDSTQLVYENEPYDLKDLYETKSEAEFDSEFGNVEKVVKMPMPPTWEEFKKVSRIQAFNRNLKEYTLFISIENKIYLNECIFEDIDYETAKWVHKKILELPPTKSNYIKALRKTVELFKEEV